MNQSEISISGIRFKYLDSSGSSMAVPINIPSTPEWPIRQHTATAYPLDLIQGKEVEIQTCLATNSMEWKDRWISIRAIRSQEDESLANPVQVVLSTTFIFKEDPLEEPGTLYSCLGKAIGYIPIKLNQDNLWEPSVGVYPSTWNWQWQAGTDQDPNGTWTDFSRTKHEIFILLSTPGLPWGNEKENSAFHLPPPPVELFRIACRWARGCTSAVNAATAITQKLAGSGRLFYNTDLFYVSDAPIQSVIDSYSRGNTKLTRLLFRLSGFIDRLNGHFGSGGNANCTDFSYMVLLLANCLGAGLSTGRLQNPHLQPDGTYSFDLNPVISTGFSSPTETSFKYHQVVFLGKKFDKEAMIFDASLGFQADPALNLPALAPVTNLPLGDAGTPGGYIARLAKDPAECQPQIRNEILTKLS